MIHGPAELVHPAGAVVAGASVTVVVKPVNDDRVARTGRSGWDLRCVTVDRDRDRLPLRNHVRGDEVEVEVAEALECRTREWLLR